MTSRLERSTRSNGRQGSTNGPDTGHSSPAESSDADEPSERELRRTRSQRREQDSQTSPNKLPLDLNGGDKGIEEDVTRCICRMAEYPGPPIGVDRNPNDGAFFIQCEKCNVWQHAGCVGFFDEDACPRHYYCENCRPDLHKIMAGKQGFQYSQYGRVNGNGGPPSTHSKSSAKESDGRSSKERDSKQSAIANSLATAKRRATMNSRAAYDDEEVLRIIEESKRNGVAADSTSGSRKSKRARDESEESEHEQKRRKTQSESGSPRENNGVFVDGESDGEESKLRNRSMQPAKRLAKPVSTPAPPEKDPKRREKEREQERAETAARRKGRSERRRVDDTEPNEEFAKAPSPSKITATSTKPQRSVPNTKTTAPAPATAAPTKKPSRPVTRRARVGRNQYTRERDAVADGRTADTRPIHSRDGEDPNGSSDGQANLLPNGSKPAKLKYMNPNRTSMNELRKRAAAILEFISRTQVEMAVDKPSSDPNSPTSASASDSVKTPRATGSGGSKLSHEIRSDKNDEEPGRDAATTSATAVATAVEERAAMEDDNFKGLNALQMMDVLSREIHHWQQEHGKWGSAAREAA